MRLFAVSKNTPGERCNWLTITRSVPFMMNVPFCGHQRNVAEEHFLLLDVADGAVAGLRVLVEDGQAHGDLERRGVRHAALFALGHVILQLQSDRVAALVAEVRRVRVVGAALVAEHIAGMERIGDDRDAAVLTGGAQVMQPFQVAALALPVADRVIHELELRDVAEVGDRKHRLKYRLQTAVVALAGQRPSAGSVRRNASAPRSDSGSGWLLEFWKNQNACGRHCSLTFGDSQLSCAALGPATEPRDVRRVNRAAGTVKNR